MRKPLLWRAGGVWHCADPHPLSNEYVGKGETPQKAYGAWVHGVEGLAVDEYFNLRPQVIRLEEQVPFIVRHGPLAEFSEEWPVTTILKKVKSWLVNR